MFRNTREYETASLAQHLQVYKAQAKNTPAYLFSMHYRSITYVQVSSLFNWFNCII